MIPVPTYEDLKAINYRELFAGAKRSLCEDRYFGILKKAAEEQGQSNQAYLLLAAIASMELGNDKKTPLQPLYGHHLFKTRPTLEDFKPEHLELLKKLLKHDIPSALLARFGDILWIKSRNYDAAIIAIKHYLKHAQELLIHRPISKHQDGINVLKRGFILTCKLGKADLQQAYRDFMDPILQERAEQEETFLSAKLMEVILEQKKGCDVSKLSEYAEYAMAISERAFALAQQNSEVECFYRAEDYSKLASQLYSKAEKPRAAKQALAHRVQALVSRQKELGGLWLDEIIKTAKKAGLPKEQIENIHRTLLESQKAWVQQNMHSTSSSEPSEQDRKIVRPNIQDVIENLPFQHAITHLSHGCELLTSEHFQQELQNIYKENPLLDLSSGYKITADERIIPQGESDRYLIYTDHWLTRINRHIFPYREAIDEKYQPSAKDLADLVENNPFIPEDRRIIFTSGLLAGFQRNYALASHLLVPQIENSLRYMLDKKGTITSKHKNNIQEVITDLGKLLKLAEEENILDHSLTFELKALLIEESGDNFRNRLAHGLVNDQDIEGPSAILAWWFVLRICIEQSPNNSFQDCP